MNKIFLMWVFLTTSTLVWGDGAAIFERCAVCHGEQAHKKSLGVSAVIAGWKEEKIIERLKGYKEKKLNQYGFGHMMSGQAVKLTETEMREVAHYISTLKPPVQESAEEAKQPETPEEIAYKKFLKEYFDANPRYGNIREATKLWEEKKAKETKSK